MNDFNDIPSTPAFTRPDPMESAARFCGTASIFMFSLIYVSLPCGALAILFGLLSRGEKEHMSAKAKRSVLFGILGIAITLLFYIYAFSVAIADAGSFENLLRQSCEMMGMDFETVFAPYFQ